MILYRADNLKVEVNVLCCLISTAAMLQQAARVRVDRWKRTEGRPHGLPHSHACRHSSTAHDLQIIKVHTLFNIIHARLSRKKRPINAYLRRCFSLLCVSIPLPEFGSGSDIQNFLGCIGSGSKNRSDQNCTIYAILEFKKDKFFGYKTILNFILIGHVIPDYGARSS
jgi:hypothetical protein